MYKCANAEVQIWSMENSPRKFYLEQFLGRGHFIMCLPYAQGHTVLQCYGNINHSAHLYDLNTQNWSYTFRLLKWNTYQNKEASDFIVNSQITQETKKNNSQSSSNQDSKNIYYQVIIFICGNHKITYY